MNQIPSSYHYQQDQQNLQLTIDSKLQNESLDEKLQAIDLISYNIGQSKSLNKQKLSQDYNN